MDELQSSCLSFVRINLLDTCSNTNSTKPILGKHNRIRTRTSTGKYGKQANSPRQEYIMNNFKKQKTNGTNAARFES